MTFNTRPWNVPLEQYRELESELNSSMSKEERNVLVKLSMHLTQRLRSNKRYGHVVAYLYREWAHKQGLEATTTWWKEYDTQQRSETTQQSEFNF